jgi:hypothetical protein
MDEERGGRKMVAVGDEYHGMLRILAALRGGSTLTGLANEFIHDGCKQLFARDPMVAIMAREVILRDTQLDEEGERGEDLRRRMLALVDQMAEEVGLADNEVWQAARRKELV